MSEKEEIFPEEADLPSLRKKYQTKVIIFPILAVLFIGWTVYAIITFEAALAKGKGTFIGISMLIAPIAGVSFLALTIKNMGPLISITDKQKTIDPEQQEEESIDRTKHYYQPDSETITLFEKGDKNGLIFSYITMGLSIAFMIFFYIGYFKVDWIPNFANLFEDVIYPVPVDILSVLGYFSSLPIIIWIYSLFDDLGAKRKQKHIEKIQNEPISFLRSLTGKSNTKSLQKPAEENQNDVDLSDSGEEFEDDFEPVDEVKEFINLHSLGWGYNLIWLSCYVIGIPLKIFLPVYLFPLAIELSPIIQIFNFVFWGIFVVVFIAYLVHFIPIWRKIKSLRIETEKE